MAVSPTGISVESLFTLFDPTRTERYRDYFASQPKEWELIAQTVLDAGESWLFDRPEVARQIIRLTPAELCKEHVVGRVYELAFSILSGSHLTEEEAVELFRAGISDSNERLVLLALPFIRQVDLTIRIAGFDSSVIHFLAQRGFVTAMQVWKDLHQEAFVDMRNSRTATPLHYATQELRVATVKWLLDNGADIDAVTSNGYTALHLSTSLPGGGALSRLLVERGAKLNIRDADGHTPLHHLAVAEGASDLYQLMVDRGADPLIEDEQGLTSEQTAAEYSAGQEEREEPSVGKEDSSSDETNHDEEILGFLNFESSLLAPLPANNFQELAPQAKRVTLDSLGFSRAHTAVLLGQADELAELTRKREIWNMDRSGRSPLDMVIALDLPELFDRMLFGTLEESLDEALEFIMHNEKSIRYFESRLRDSDFLDAFWTRLEKHSSRESLIEKFPLDRFFYFHELFTPDQLRARMATRCQKEVAQVEQSLYYLIGVVMPLLRATDASYIPEQMEQHFAERAIEQLNDFSSYQIAAAAANRTVGPILGMAIDKMERTYQRLVLSQLSQEAFALFMSRLAPDQRTPYLRLAPTELKKFWVEKIFIEIQAARLKWKDVVEEIHCEQQTLLAEEVGAKRKREEDEQDLPNPKRLRLDALRGRSAGFKSMLEQKAIRYERLQRSLLEGESSLTNDLAAEVTTRFGEALSEMNQYVESMKQIMEELPTEELPAVLRCPILGEKMRDPVRAADGQVYEREAIRRWFETCTETPTSPLTREPLESDELVPVSLDELLASNEKRDNA